MLQHRHSLWIVRATLSGISLPSTHERVRVSFEIKIEFVNEKCALRIYGEKMHGSRIFYKLAVELICGI